MKLLLSQPWRRESVYWTREESEAVHKSCYFFVTFALHDSRNLEMGELGAKGTGESPDNDWSYLHNPLRAGHGEINKSVPCLFQEIFYS